MVAPVLITLAVLAALFTASWRFNRHVDSRPIAARADGETALWVIAGCAYVTAGASILVAVWSPWLPHDWRLGLAVGAITFIAFAAGGLPMALGDHKRSAADRRTDEALDRAARHLGVGYSATLHDR
jgi:drug/metabolite transporter (DMT)-like permease